MINSSDTILEEYIFIKHCIYYSDGCYKNHTLQCMICKNEWNVDLNAVRYEKCFYENKHKKITKKIRQFIKHIEGSVECIDNMLNLIDNYTFRCLNTECGYIWENNINIVTYQGCVKCGSLL